MFPKFSVVVSLRSGLGSMSGNLRIFLPTFEKVALREGMKGCWEAVFPYAPFSFHGRHSCEGRHFETSSGPAPEKIVKEGRGRKDVSGSRVLRVNHPSAPSFLLSV